MKLCTKFWHMKMSSQPVCLVLGSHPECVKSVLMVHVRRVSGRLPDIVTYEDWINRGAEAVQNQRTTKVRQANSHAKQKVHNLQLSCLCWQMPNSDFLENILYAFKIHLYVIFQLFYCLTLLPKNVSSFLKGHVNCLWIHEAVNN